MLSDKQKIISTLDHTNQFYKGYPIDDGFELRIDSANCPPFIADQLVFKFDNDDNLINMHVDYLRR